MESVTGINELFQIESIEIEKVHACNVCNKDDHVKEHIEKYHKEIVSEIVNDMNEGNDSESDNTSNDESYDEAWLARFYEDGNFIG